jgi:hypothetical protein
VPSYSVHCLHVSGSRSVQVQSFKIWGINNSAAQCGSAENMSPQCVCCANLKSPTCIMFTEHFLFDLSECWWTVQVCLLLVILLPSVTLELHVLFPELVILVMWKLVCYCIGYTTILWVNKGKAIPLQAWTGPEGSRRLRLSDFMTSGTCR